MPNYPYVGYRNYAAGDYYRGDPGLLSFVGSIAKKAAGVIGKVIGSTPVGAAVGGVIGAIGKPSVAMQIQPPTFVGGGLPDVPKSLPGAIPQPGIRGTIERFLPFGQSGYQAAPAGYHVNKAYRRYLIAKAMGKDVQDPFSEPRARNAIVRNRSMNIANGRALKRAVSRAQGFARYARSVLSFVDARAPKGRPKFKRKRSR